MRILITGGFGYIGGRLVEAIRNDDGIRLRVQTRKIPTTMAGWAEGLDISVAEITAPNDLIGICNGVDAVVHLASTDENECENDPVEALEVNVRGTYQILQEAIRANVKRFLYLSTFRVYGDTSGNIIRESLIPHPTHHYGITRLMAEHYVRHAGLKQHIKPVIVRLSNAFGSPVSTDVDRWTLVFNDFCLQSVKTGRITIRSSGLQHRDFIPIPDVTHAIQLLLKTPDEKLKYDTYNLGSGTSMTILEAARLVKKVSSQILGKNILIESSEVGPNESHEQIQFDISRMRELGFVPKYNPEAEISRTLKLCMKAASS